MFLTRFLVLFHLVLCVFGQSSSTSLSDEEIADITDQCCEHGKSFAVKASAVKQCNDAEPPDDLDGDQTVVCLASLRSCCQQQFKSKEDCTAGMAYAPAKRCSVPKTDIGKTCCEECSFGALTGASQGKEACPAPSDEFVSPTSALRQTAFYQCCLEAAEKPKTTEPPVTTTKVPETTPKPKEKCKSDSCDHICNDGDGKIRCSCREGFRLQADKRTCKDINECAEADEDLCTAEGTVCHNVPGTFKCVPIKKREERTISCPPGFKRNLENQVCDDINECQSPRPPCPKYLCKNTIGGYECAGKPGKPYTEETPGKVTEPPDVPPPKNDICPPGFRSGPTDECLDIDECAEHSDDCQRLSQYCINTHGSFFCQDHVSKRCAPGFMVNKQTGICQDINECEIDEVCQRNEVCVNMPGAYTCKSKISTLPQLGATSKNCQEGTRPRPGGAGCEDIDECLEGTHLCDQFQNCVNSYGGHECQCKEGFVLDSSGSCVDVDECALKLENCREGTHCINVVGSFSCARRPATTTSTTLPPLPAYEYEYYDSEEDNSTTENETTPEVAPPSPALPPRPAPVTPKITTTTPRTTPPPTRSTRPPYVPRPTTTTRRPYTNRPRPARPPPPPPLPPRPDTRRPETPDTSRRHEDSYNENKPEVHEDPIIPKRAYETTAPTTKPDDIIPTRPLNRRPETVTEVTVPAPTNPDVIEREKDDRGVYGIDSSDIPKDRWTNVIGRDKPEKPGGDNEFNPDDVHCLNGFERNDRGKCVDINECEDNRHICSALEVCENRAGGYTCNCKPGYRRNSTGWCVPEAPVTTTSSTTETPPPPRPLPPRPDPERPYSPRASERPYVPAPQPLPPRPESYNPRPRDRPRPQPTSCNLGYTYDFGSRKCVDIDECATNTHNCAADEVCINFEGGFRCSCRRCQPTELKPNYALPPRERPDSNVITVGAQYGQRGPRQQRPATSLLPDGNGLLYKCPWGYKLTPNKICEDIDECAKQVSECGPQQRCENFYGGYSCQCPAGHRLLGKADCEDIDECSLGKPCPHNSQCVNTVGSYRCECGEGFRNAPSNEKVCVDIDECAETPEVCEQGCANSWGGYRCYCKKGYHLSSDNRTCEDRDECAEWSAVRLRGRLCGGTCINEPGSYRCSCPAGYRLSGDGRSCVDIDECETGEATCARAGGGEVCQNTRGGYHCHRINCPPGYRLESKHRCSRVVRSCPISDWDCLHQPSSYSYNFITFVANIYLPQGSVDLFTMHGPSWADAVVSFELRMVEVQASPGVTPVDLGCFDMRPSANICVISLVCSPAGPQVAELELTMSLYQRGQFAGSAVARLVVIVSQYDF